MKLAPFKLERYFARYEFVAPYLLCPSDCEALSLEDVLALELESARGIALAALQPRIRGSGRVAPAVQKRALRRSFAARRAV